MKKVGDITLAETIGLEADAEEVEGTEPGGGVDKVSIISVVSLRGPFGILSLGSFLSVGSSSKPSHSSLPSSLGARHINKFFKKRKGSKKNLLSHSMRRTGARNGGS